MAEKACIVRTRNFMTNRLLARKRFVIDKFDLLHSSGTLGQETMKEKLQRAMNYKRAGLPVPSNIPLFRERPGRQHDMEEDQDPMKEEPELVKGRALQKGRIQVDGVRSVE